MSGLAFVLITIVLGSSSWAQLTPPPQILDLCRSLKSQIINQATSSPVDVDFFGMARPSAGGSDIGAIECDSGAPPEPGQIRLVLESFPPAPTVCQAARWTLSGDPTHLAHLQLVLKTPAGGPGQVVTLSTMETSMACHLLPHPPGDSWRAVLQAIDHDQKVVATSNEVELLFTPSVLPPPGAGPKPPTVPTIPPPLPWPGLPPVSKLPELPPGPAGRITDTDVWKGVGAMPKPPSVPPGKITETCVWKGVPCPP